MKNKLIKTGLMCITLGSMLAYGDTSLYLNFVESNQKVNRNVMNYYQVRGFAGDTIESKISHLSADVDLYVKVGSKPTKSKYDCRPYHGRQKDEVCTSVLAQDTYVYIGVNGFRAGDYDIIANLVSSKVKTIAYDQEVFGISPRLTYREYKIHANAGDKLKIRAYGMDADGDLFVKVGAKADKNHYDKKSIHQNRSDEEVSIEVDHDTDVYIGLYASKNCQHTVEHTIKVTKINTIEETIVLHNRQVIRAHVGYGQWNYFKISASQGDTVESILNGLKHDADLYVKIGAKPTKNSYDCRPYHGGRKNEVCTNILTQDAEVYMGVHGYRETDYNIVANIHPLADTTKPVITLKGSAEVNIIVGTSYIDAAASAMDNIDGDITDEIIVGGDSVDTNTVGTYIITYDVRDNAGNVANQIHRTVNVILGNQVHFTECPEGSVTTNKPCAVSTFHNLSIYWNSEDIGTVDLSYRKRGESLWHKAQALKYNKTLYLDKDYIKTDTVDLESSNNYPGDNTVKYDKGRRIVVKVAHGSQTQKASYRGSIVNLTPNTIYEIKVGNNAVLYAKTWSNTFPSEEISNAHKPTSHHRQYVIDKLHGSKNAYKLIDGKKMIAGGEKYVIDSNTAYNILIKNSSYIILRNFKLTNAKEDAIRIMGRDSHHIIIEHCDISKWGALDKVTNRDRSKFKFSVYKEYAKDSQGGIASTSGLYGSVFQYNMIHDPNFPSNTWGQFNLKNYSNMSDFENEDWYHPRGAIAIMLKYCKIGNNVIRYNNLYATTNKFLDIVGGGKNNGKYGFPGADSDIYGNYFSGAADEAIEVEGGDQNVRIWNNYIDHTFMAIGNALVSAGPLYIWNNITGVVDRIKHNECYTPDGVKNRCDVDGFKQYASFLKMGKSGKVLDANGKKVQGNASYDSMQGDMYIYNNTLLNHTNNKGYAGIGTSYKPKAGNNQKGKVMRHIYSKNNILDVNAPISAISVGHKYSNSDSQNHIYNMMKVSLDQYPKISHSIEAKPIYKQGKVILNLNTKEGDFRLRVGTVGTEAGICVENIIPVPIPDVGAQQRNKQKMVFGIGATFVPPTIVSCP